MRIYADLFRRDVVWKMTAADARDLAEFIEESLPSGDLALQDVADLRAAADRLDPPDVYPPEG